MEPDARLNKFIPQTYRDKKSRQNSDFFFISYSHRDRELVFLALQRLFDNSVNYWYDVDLDPGDKWNARVEKEMRNEHCRGAIIFLSENSLISDAVQKEIVIMMDIASNRSFRTIPVVIGFENAKSLILHVANKDDGFYDKGYKLFKDLTKDDIWVHYDDAVDKISDFSNKENVKDAYERSFLRELNHRSDNGERTFFLGKYPLEEDGVPKDIEWIEVCNKGDLFYFISKYCLDFVDETNINCVIEKIRQTMTSLRCVENVSLIDETFLNNHVSVISKSRPTDYADRNSQQLLRLYWILQGDGRNGQSLVLFNSNNYKIENKIQTDKINAGVRLVLTINNNKIGEWKNA